MAQVMVNFRLDEDIKKDMELACREMGLSMTAAFTIFAKKVGKERRIPFEVAAQPHVTGPCRQRQGPAQAGQGLEGTPPLAWRQERLERLCVEIRRSLTAIHTAIPASITGLSMERIRLLCGDGLKDQAAAAASASRALFSGQNAETLWKRDLGILDEYADGLSSIAGELSEIGRTLIPAMKARPGGEADSFEAYGQRLAAVSRKFDELAPIMQRFLASTACNGGARAAAARIRQAAAEVETAYVRTALESLEALVLRHYDSLDSQTASHLEADYLRTLELALRELGRAEREGGEAGTKAALCLRAINVLSQAVSTGSQARQEWNERSLEAEVTALERLAAMRGDIGGSARLEA